MKAYLKRSILIKPESTYGTDSSPVAANAVQCGGLEIMPLEGSGVERDFSKSFFGSSGSIRVENFATVSFDTEIAGAGAAGTAPAWGNLMKASNFSETITASAITGTAQVGGSTTSIKLASGASAIDDFYTGMTISISSGTGSANVPAEIISYSGSTKIATIDKAWATAPDGTSAYSIGANVIYTPNSDFGISVARTSVSIYFILDGIRHVLLGARGTPSFDLASKTIPKIKWKFTGLLGTISDSALPANDFSGWQLPVAVSTANTTNFNLLGFTDAALASLTIDIANKVTHRQLVGSETVLITDRKPVGTVSIEATSVTAKDWFGLVQASTTGVFCIKHGQTAGNIVGFTAPKVQLNSPKYSNSDDVAMIDLGLEFIPFGSAGNDELRICVK